ncbi:MAG: hypothetical protein KIA11_06605, partial [Corynebacterium sp.]|nr:hypothetical protein [Corynebacterium sp.]
LPVLRPDVRSKIFTPPHAPHVGQSTARSWSTEIGCGDWHTIAVRRDGTALATGNNQRGQTDVARWTHVSGVFDGYLHTVGLHEDGTVVAVSDDSRGQCEVSSWRSITSVAAGSVHTLALSQTGRVFGTGDNQFGQCDVQSWTGITAIAAGARHSLGLRATTPSSNAMSTPGPLDHR